MNSTKNISREVAKKAKPEKPFAPFAAVAGLTSLLLLCCMPPAATAQNLLRAKPQTNSVSSLANSNFIPVEIPSLGTNSTQLISVSNLLESLMDLPNWTGGSSTTSGIFTNVIYVNANGASQAANGALLTNAFESDLQGVRIIVGPGDYFVGEIAVPSPAFSQDNRIIEFQPGVNFRAGSTNSAAFHFFDDSAGKLTNVHVVGRANFFQTNAPGGSGSLMFLENGSTVRFEHENYFNTNGDSCFNLGGVGNNTLAWITHGRASTWSYDNAYFHAEITNRVRAHWNEIESVGDIIEVGGDAIEWGDVEISYNRAWARNGISGQYSILQLGGRCILHNGVLTVERTNASIYSTSATTNGLIEGGIIIMPQNGIRSILQDNSSGDAVVRNGKTDFWLKNIYMIGPTNIDPFTLTNSTGELVLENVRLAPGWSSTNAIRGMNGVNKVRIVGNLEVHPYKPFGTGITLVGTNTASSIRNVGTFVNHGAAYFSNLVYAIGNITSGGDINAANFVATGDIDGANINASAAIGTAALNLGNPTPSSLLMVNGNGDATNVTLSGASIAGTTLTIAAQTNSSIVRQTELTASSNALVTLSSNNVRVAAGSGVSVASAGSGGVQTFTVTATGGSSGGTSNSIPVVTMITNVNIGFGSMQSLAMTTPSNQFVNFQGTETNGDTVELAVTNSAATNITITFNLDGTTSSYYDPTAGTNRSSFVVSPGGKILTFVYSTNWGAIWRLNAYIGRELELATAKGFGVGLLSSTNGDTLTLTATRTNAITYAPTNGTSLTVDWTGTEHVIIPNLLETNIVIIPTNMIVGREIYLTFLPGSVSYNISISNAAGTRVRWNLQTNSGNAALTKTNVIQVEASLLYQTNGISAAVGRFIY